ncbi:MAG: hypothetical protein N2Z69_00585 [Methylophilaceae bacterium]|nr:hypothetical protein [Methylophilaceae bacterium]
MRRSLFSLLLFFPLVALADAQAMTRVLKETPAPQQFSFCWGGTCAEVVRVHLGAEEWAQVRDLFDPAPDSAEQERTVVSQAIGLLERIVGPKTGTAGDRAGTFGNGAWPGQLDCNDEATNTTTYLRMMQHDGLLKFHQVLDTTTRGGFLIFGRHSSAVIAERASGERYAVDSWFYDNGQPAVVLPLKLWSGGWRPADSSAH